MRVRCRKQLPCPAQQGWRRFRARASMWMPGKSCKVIVGHVVPKVVEQQEWIKLRRVAEPKRAAQMHACAFERWFGFDQALDRAYRHSCSPVSRVGVRRASLCEPYGSAVDCFRQEPC